MISSQKELEVTLRKVADIKRQIDDTLGRHEGQEAELYVASYKAVLRDYMVEVTSYIDFFEQATDLRFGFDRESYLTTDAALSVHGGIFSEFQSLIWDSAERVLGLTPRRAGKPISRVFQNCTLTLAHSNLHRGVVGLDFIQGDLLFPDFELRDRTLGLVSNAVTIINEESAIEIERQSVDARLISKIKSFTQLISSGFNEATLYGRRQEEPSPTSLRLAEFDSQTPKKAEKLLMTFARSYEREVRGTLMVLNFFTHQITVSGQDKVKMIFDSATISEEQVADAALREVLVRGMQFVAADGTPVEFVPRELTVLG